MTTQLKYIARALRDLLQVVEEHATPTIRAHATTLQKARKALFDINRLIAALEYIFSDILDEESESE